MSIDSKNIMKKPRADRGKTVKLKPFQVKKLQSYIIKFPSVADAAREMNVPLNVLEKVIINLSGDSFYMSVILSKI